MVGHGSGHRAEHGVRGNKSNRGGGRSRPVKNAAKGNQRERCTSCAWRSIVGQGPRAKKDCIDNERRGRRKIGITVPNSQPIFVAYISRVQFCEAPGASDHIEWPGRGMGAHAPASCWAKIVARAEVTARACPALTPQAKRPSRPVAQKANSWDAGDLGLKADQAKLALFFSRANSDFFINFLEKKI